MKKDFSKKWMIASLLATSVTFPNVVIYGQAYSVQPGDSLYNIAARYGTTVEALQQNNSLTSTALYPGQTLTVASKLRRAASIQTKYTVKPGDSLYLISQRFGISVNALKSANNLSGNYLNVGKILTIPSSSGSGTSGSSIHYVKTGESLYLIAQKYGITVNELKNANRLSGNTILSGQALTIPARSSSGNNRATNYTVQDGDSLFLIATRNGISLNELLRANNLNSNSAIYPGQRLVIPQSSPSNSGANYKNYYLSTGDLELLARLVSAESSGESLEGQIAVAATVLNRLIDSRYPNSIPGIIYQVDQGSYQYSPVLDGRINLAASPTAIKAVQLALTGWDPSNGANGFYNPAKTTNQWVRSQTVTKVIGNHVFFSY